jgi:iron-sulfur cluster assembly protein
LLTITDKAAEMALKVLAAEGKANWGIRIYIAGSGHCGPTYGLNPQEESMPNDEVIAKNGLRIFVDRELSQTLSGLQLDYYKDENVEGFVFTGTNPSCGPSCSSCGH